jgi:hypothetical protein
MYNVMGCTLITMPPPGIKIKRSMGVGFADFMETSSSGSGWKPLSGIREV